MVKSPTNISAIVSGVDWLKRAQDASKDNGVAGWFSPLTGWNNSYIETTGYIITTFLDVSKFLKDESLVLRARKMGDFLLDNQLSNGGFRTHTAYQKKISHPRVFNTGQDIMGLLDLFSYTGDEKYLASATKASDFLCNIQNKDGSWTKFTYGSSFHAYHSRVAYALAKNYKISGEEKHLKAAISSLNWVMAQQLENGWFKNNSLPDQKNDTPYTHTIAYAIEGLLWAYVELHESKFLHTAQKTADAMLNLYRNSDYLFGAFDKHWKNNGNYTCLTGDAQIAVCWLKLYQITGDTVYLNCAQRMNDYLKSKQLGGPFNVLEGSLAGSSPLWGDIFRGAGYSRLAFLNWATKFMIDSLLLEELILRHVRSTAEIYKT